MDVALRSQKRFAEKNFRPFERASLGEFGSVRDQDIVNIIGIIQDPHGLRTDDCATDISVATHLFGEKMEWPFPHCEERSRPNTSARAWRKFRTGHGTARQCYERSQPTTTAVSTNLLSHPIAWSTTIGRGNFSPQPVRNNNRNR